MKKNSPKIKKEVTTPEMATVLGDDLEGLFDEEFKKEGAKDNVILKTPRKLALEALDKQHKQEKEEKEAALDLEFDMLSERFPGIELKAGYYEFSGYRFNYFDSKRDLYYQIGKPRDYLFHEETNTSIVNLAEMGRLIQVQEQKEKEREIRQIVQAELSNPAPASRNIDCAVGSSMCPDISFSRYVGHWFMAGQGTGLPAKKRPHAVQRFLVKLLLGFTWKDNE